MKLADLEKFAKEIIDIEREIAIKRASIALSKAKGEEQLKDEGLILDRAYALLPKVEDYYRFTFANNSLICTSINTEV